MVMECILLFAHNLGEIGLALNQHGLSVSKLSKNLFDFLELFVCALLHLVKPFVQIPLNSGKQYLFVILN